MDIIFLRYRKEEREKKFCNKVLPEYTASSMHTLMKTFWKNDMDPTAYRTCTNIRNVNDAHNHVYKYI